MSLEVATSQGLSLIFPTPILTRTLFKDSFNERLARLILSHRRHGEGKRLSGGGWQSASDLLDWPQLEVRLLAAEIFDAVERIHATGASGNDRDANRRGSVVTERHLDAVSLSAEGWSPNGSGSAARSSSPYHGCAWANVNGGGHYNPLSVQAGYQWCAIYHVATGKLSAEHTTNGALELTDPRPAAQFANLERFAFGEPIEIEPKPGLVVIFPAWLQYCVHPFFGMGHRISITMNITFEEERSGH